MLLIKALIGLLLVITPFFVLPNQDTREPKMYLALIGVALVNLSVFYYGMFKPVKNKWILIFLAYIPVSILFSAKPGLQLVGIWLGNFWIWKTSLFFILFSLFVISIYSIDFTKKDIESFLKIMFWCGFIMACYVILQFFGLDQFYMVQSRPVTQLPPSAMIGGTLGHPTIVSPFIAMIIPIALYFRKYLFAILMIIAVLLTKSQVAIGAMCLSLFFIVMLKNKRLFVITIMLLVIVLGFNYKFIQNRGSGRFETWKMIVQDIKNPLTPELKSRYTFTGFGPGSFQYLFHIKHQTGAERFLQAHNEYLELSYDMGIIGLFILLCGMFQLVKDNFVSKINRYRKYLLASFICIALCAGGTFVWHIAPIMLYSSVIVGLLMKPIQEEEL